MNFDIKTEVGNRLNQKEQNQTHKANGTSPRPPAEEHQNNDEGTNEFASVTPWPGPFAPEAYHGLAGDIVRTIEPHSEADPVALLGQVLVAFGNIIGRTAHFVAEDDCHYLNEFLILVGKTSKGRKGSSWNRVKRILDSAESSWVTERCLSGLSSGEGLIWSVRDPVMGRESMKDKGRITGYREVETDPGVEDKRLLIYEAEFALVLRQIERQGNTLSAILRQGWESGALRTLTKNAPAKATGAHISLVGHCTVDELQRYLSATESANGYGNRHLWLCVRRSKILPEGSALDGLLVTELGGRLAEALRFARTVGRMARDDQARELWGDVYEELSEGKPGLCGSLLARAEAHVMRLACIYALLDLSAVVNFEHLKAALALWKYCEQSVRFIFGDSLGDPVADEILRALRNARDGLTRTAIRDLFGRHRSADEIGRALGVLQEHGLACMRPVPTNGRPEERWFAVRK